MDVIHMQDDLNAKDTIISDLKYKLKDSQKGKKETALEIAILKRSNGELNDGLQNQSEQLLEKEKEILRLETDGSGTSNAKA